MTPRKSPPKTIPFVNNKGRIVHLDKRMTISDLVKAGIEFKLSPRGTPLPDGWHRNKNL